MYESGDDIETDWPAGESSSLSSDEVGISIKFSSTELSKAIAEVGWGLLAWEILSSSVNETNESTTTSSAKLELLEEGRNVIVEVSERGWRVVLVEGFENAIAFEDRSFETLDNLLSVISPAFENRRMKLLMDSLENISTRRSWDELS